MDRYLTRWLDIPDLRRIDVYEAHGGYGALRKALFEMTPEQIINEVKNSNLRGAAARPFRPASNGASSPRTPRSRSTSVAMPTRASPARSPTATSWSTTRTP